MLLRPLLVAGLALTTIAACDSNDGPLEEAGENLDNAVEETTDEMEEATDLAFFIASNAKDNPDGDMPSGFFFDLISVA